MVLHDLIISTFGFYITRVGSLKKSELTSILDENNIDEIS